MTKISTKKALIMSMLSMLLCISMLVGSTFAWFTDTASTAVNTIQAGTLDVALEMATAWDDEGNPTTWESAEGKTLEFKKATGAAENEAVLWEPGCTYELPELRISNNGTLALQYKIQLTGINGSAKLNEVIDWTIGDVALGTEQHLTAGANNEFTIKGHMQVTAGNEYQNETIDGISITVVATQDTVEYDSYSDQYDAAAEYATPVTTSDELVAAITDGEDVVLKNDVTLPENTTLGITKSVTIYGDGTTSLKWNGSNGAGRVINIESTNKGDLKNITLTLSGVNIVGPTDNSYNRGVSAWGVENLTIIMDNCTASANHYALNIAAENTNAKVIIRNTTLTGYSAFQTWSAGTNATFENCTLIGVNRWSGSTDDFATIVLASQNSEDNAKNSTLTFKNCTIKAEKQGTATERLLYVGATGATVTFEGCKFFVNSTEVTGDAIKDNMQLKDDTTLTIK